MRKGPEHDAVQMERWQADRGDRIEFGQAQQGYRERELHAGRRQRLLRLRSDQEKSRHRVEFPRAGLRAPFALVDGPGPQSLRIDVDDQRGEQNETADQYLQEAVDVDVIEPVVEDAEHEQ